jgi:protein-S-isoprenylcysteine O-methyltransferase Ste14
VPWYRIDLAIWAVFGVVWFVAAPFSRRTVHREAITARLRYGLPLALGVFLVLSSRVSAVSAALEARVLPQSDALGAVGCALTALGVGFAIWARAHLGRMWSGTITLKEGHHLVDTGPYAIARHPIYTGAIVGLVGSALVVGTVAACVGVPLACLALVWKLGREEQLMAATFGEAHAAYRARVKRLVPFVW